MEVGILEFGSTNAGILWDDVSSQSMVAVGDDDDDVAEVFSLIRSTLADCNPFPAMISTMVCDAF